MSLSDHLLENLPEASFYRQKSEWYLQRSRETTNRKLKDALEAVAREYQRRGKEAA